MRGRLRISDASWVMLGFGWTPQRKGVDTMLEALKLLLEEGRDVTLLLVGTEELTSFLGRWPDRSCIPFTRVIPPEEYVGDLFAAADVFVSPSRAEAWPYSVAEAMANAVPVACSSIPAVSWAEDSPGVFFSPPGDAVELAKNVRRIELLPPHMRKRAVEKSRLFVCSRHTVERWGQSVWNLYANLLNWHEPPTLKQDSVWRRVSA
jgi:glycosyltransferase involved in cell wall biosynthesis